jgi:hypothetical protein
MLNRCTTTHACVSCMYKYDISCSGRGKRLPLVVVIAMHAPILHAANVVSPNGLPLLHHVWQARRGEEDIVIDFHDPFCLVASPHSQQKRERFVWETGVAFLYC